MTAAVTIAQCIPNCTAALVVEPSAAGGVHECCGELMGSGCKAAGKLLTASTTLEAVQSLSLDDVREANERR